MDNYILLKHTHLLRKFCGKELLICFRRHAWGYTLSGINQLCQWKKRCSGQQQIIPVWSQSSRLQLHIVVQGSSCPTLPCIQPHLLPWPSRKQHPVILQQSHTWAVGHALGSRPCVLLLLYGWFIECQMQRERKSHTWPLFLLCQTSCQPPTWTHL